MNLHQFPTSIGFLFGGFGPWIIGLIVPIVALVFAAVMGVTNRISERREREEWHRTARLALEKGQPVPPMPSSEGSRHEPPPGINLTEWQAARRSAKQRRDFKAGLILLAIGLALYFTETATGGALVGAIGVALLATVVIDRMFLERPARSEPRNPTS